MNGDTIYTYTCAKDGGDWLVSQSQVYDIGSCKNYRMEDDLNLPHLSYPDDVCQFVATVPWFPW